LGAPVRHHRPTRWRRKSEAAARNWAHVLFDHEEELRHECGLVDEPLELGLRPAAAVCFGCHRRFRCGANVGTCRCLSVFSTFL
jgi:hypothetical protein